MKKVLNKFFPVVLLQLILLLHSAATARSVQVTGWKFREAGSRKWYPATVPGTVQSDLLRWKKIPDPFKESNELKVQWVGQKNWEYLAGFKCTALERNAPSVQLVFGGLDTYAAVYLNDSLLFESDNMFVTYSFEVKPLLRDDNSLRIVFFAPEEKAKAEAAKLKYTLPEGLRSFTRKAQYQYGWDWGPKILTCGIWQPVYLQYNSNVQPLLLKVRREQNTIVAAVKMYAAQSVKTSVQLTSVAGNVKLLHECTLQPGEQWITFPVPQPDVQLWNPWNMGQQTIYDYTVTVPGEHEVVKCTTGFRDALLIRERDSVGASFGFRINGRDVFARGANVIPPHLFLPGVPDAEYEKLVQRAREANCTMLRVWGGGVYLPDIFYTLCDRYGIMVWQDFMFACSMIPGNDTFLNSVSLEASQQVERLSVHPSVVLWCGNNESDEGWHNWGWQKQFGYSAADSAEIWNNYERVFHRLLPAVVDSLGNEVAYVSSSPLYGWGREKSMKEGDSHYWGVWWGLEPFENYREKVPRFMSEYGFQSMPDVSAWKNIVHDPSLTSPHLRHHQKHPRGFETIDTMLQQYFFRPGNFSDYSYLSQLQQAFGMKMAIDAHRSGYPYCRGSLFWQWNDCWPVVSWSAMDNRYRRKLFYFEAKRLFEPFYCSTSETGSGLITGLHYDGGVPLSINLRTYFVSTIKPSPPALLDERDILLKGDTTVPAAIRFPASQLGFLNKRETIIVSEAYDKISQKVIGRNFLLRCRPNELTLDTAAIGVFEFSPGMIIINSDVFTYGVYLYDEKGEMEFSDNGFHLLPGEQKEIMYTGGKSSMIKVKCLNNLVLKAEPGR